MKQEEFDRALGEKRDTAEYRAAYAAAQLAIELGAQVREARLHRGWTQTELARRAGMRPHAVSRLEAGDVVPTLMTLERVAAALEARLSVTVEDAA